MPKRFHLVSFAFGVLVVAILACAIGAARSVPADAKKYDAAPSITMNGIGIQIVDHDANTLFIYERSRKPDDVVSYKLIETIDLTQAGKVEIQLKQTK